jgi:squalene synthase HpnC
MALDRTFDHYENFPVASWVLPSRLREPVRSIYSFARRADDIADEGNAPAHERLAELARLARELDRIAAGATPSTTSLAPLAQTIHRHALPIELFRDLLSAFAQDVTTKRYATFDDVMDYCRRSADPIGRLLLHLYREHDERRASLSDRICSSLQLINFLQDVAIDFAKGRIYLPQDEMRRFGVDEGQIARGEAGEAWRALMSFQIERAHRLMQAGMPLAGLLRGRIGLELRMIVLGGERILQKLRDCGGDVFRRRPVLERRDWVGMFLAALSTRRASP